MRKQFKQFFVWALALTMLSGCSQAVDVTLQPEISVFHSDTPKVKKQLSSDSEVYQALQRWLNEQRSHWLSTSGQYPGGVYFVSGKNGIQVTDRHVVLYANITTMPKAIYIQEIDRNTLKIIKEMTP